MVPSVVAPYICFVCEKPADDEQHDFGGECLDVPRAKCGLVGLEVAYRGSCLWGHDKNRRRKVPQGGKGNEHGWPESWAGRADGAGSGCHLTSTGAVRPLVLTVSDVLPRINSYDDRRGQRAFNVGRCDALISIARRPPGALPAGAGRFCGGITLDRLTDRGRCVGQRAREPHTSVATDSTEARTT